MRWIRTTASLMLLTVASACASPPSPIREPPEHVWTDEGDTHFLVRDAPGGVAILNIHRSHFMVGGTGVPDTYLPPNLIGYVVSTDGDQLVVESEWMYHRTSTTEAAHGTTWRQWVRLRGAPESDEQAQALGIVDY